MNSLFDKAAYEEISNRMARLSPQATAQWGKMQVAQMLAHCAEAFKVPLTDHKLPRMFMGMLLGWMFKGQLSNDTPYKQGLPTAPNFIIKDARDFEGEKNKLMMLITDFYTKGPDKVGNHPHPFFGKLTKDAWGKSMYKHMDHHLKQFGA